jgi:uncharacterized membrane protein YhiD involved in acid resistance
MIAQSYFTVFTWEKAIFYLVALVYVAGTCLAVVIQPFAFFECKKSTTTVKFENPAYVANPCYQERHAKILFLTIAECIFARRIIAAVLLGGLIGWERRQADRPAGIRTMALVSLGSCLFSICSAFAFLDGPMNWDASRVAAAIPSGVGFLGSALIFKQNDEGSHTVHGLTTAASVWLSAAVGIACAGGLYFLATFCTAIVLVLLRFGPRINDTEEEEDEVEEEVVVPPVPKSYHSTGTLGGHDNVEAQRLIGAAKTDSDSQRGKATIRQRPQLL